MQQLEDPALIERVRAAVDAARPELQELIDVEVDRVLAELVRERVAHGDNGSQKAPETAQDAPAASPQALEKTCRSCGATKPLSQFARNRRVCRSCRRDQERVRERTRNSEGDEEEA